MDSEKDKIGKFDEIEEFTERYFCNTGYRMMNVALTNIYTNGCCELFAFMLKYIFKSHNLTVYGCVGVDPGCGVETIKDNIANRVYWHTYVSNDKIWFYDVHGKQHIDDICADDDGETLFLTEEDVKNIQDGKPSMIDKYIKDNIFTKSFLVLAKHSQPSSPILRNNNIAQLNKLFSRPSWISES